MLTLLVGSTAASPLVVPSGGCVRLGNGPNLTCTFDYTGAAEPWTVPDGVSSVSFDLFGAQGGIYQGTGGKGGEVAATLAVSAGDTLDIAVGQLGIGGCPPFGDPFSAPAFGGGAPARCGSTGSGGGGGSSVSSSGTRLLVAGGGGGAASGNTGGPGGDTTGGDGLPAAPTDSDGAGGKGGTQSAGGAAGAEASFGPGNIPPDQTHCDTNAAAAPGTSGSGGIGGQGGSNFDAGGGGGGYYGGGGGGGGAYCFGGTGSSILGSAGSGGGGSSFADPATTDVSMNSGVREGNGVVTVTFSSPDTDGLVPGVTINQASGQADPTGTSPIVYTAVFSESVTGFTSADVSITGTAGGTKSVAITEVAPMDGTTYEVSVSGMTTTGTVIATIPAGGATGADFSTNVASASADNTVTFDAAPPSVTIDEASGQADPTTVSPITFAVVFDEPVTGFGDSSGDVDLSGTAGATTAVVTETVPNDGTTYNVAVSGMTSDGTVIASIPANAGTDAGGNGNTASASTDNTVTFVFNVSPTATVTGGSCSPTNMASGTINLTLSDADGDALTFAFVSNSNPTLISNPNIVVGGSGSARTLTVTGAAKKSGSAILTFNLSDGTVTVPVVVTVKIGTAKNETLNGTTGIDMMFGLAGKNTLNGDAGNDLLCGGNSNDTLNGGNGNDVLDGGNGDDVLSGGNNNDILRGASGNDTLTGGTGADSFSGGSGTDTATDFTVGDTSDGS